MNIAIFETEHFEAAYPLARLFDQEGNRIVLISYPSSYDQLSYLLKDQKTRYDWVIKKEKQSKISFIRTIYRETKKRKIDLLYLNTVSNNFLFYALLRLFLPRVRVVMTLHTINTLFETKNKLRPRRMIRHLGKIILRSVVKEFNVLSPTMVPYLKQRLPAHKKVHSIPGGIFEKNTSEVSLFLQNPVRVVIPGSVDAKRRNYDQAFELLVLAEKENLPLVLTFLGGLYGDYGHEVAARGKQWNERHNNLVFYTAATISQQEFDNTLAKADFIFNPSVIHTSIEDDVKETYGLSMSSGNISDVIRHARPFIVPRELAIDPLLENSCIRYDTVADILSALINSYKNTGYHEALVRTAMENSRQFTVEKIRSRHPDVFGPISL